MADYGKKITCKDGSCMGLMINYTADFFLRIINNGTLDEKLTDNPVQNEYLNNMFYLKKLTDNYEKLMPIWEMIALYVLHKKQN